MPSGAGSQMNGDSPTPVLLSVAQCAEALSISTWSVRHLLRTHQLGRVRIGTRVLIPQAELERFIAERLEPSGPENQVSSWRTANSSGRPDGKQD